MDKAGQQYWNLNWESATTVIFEPGRSGITHYRDRMLGHLIGRALGNLTYIPHIARRISGQFPRVRGNRGLLRCVEFDQALGLGLPGP